MELRILPEIKKPLTHLSKGQQQRFIKKLQDENFSKDFRLGMEIALIMLGYEVVKPE